MTEEEVAKLKVGDVLQSNFTDPGSSKRLRSACVVVGKPWVLRHCYSQGKYAVLVLRIYQDDERFKGRKAVKVRRMAPDLFPPLDPATANVYADWLIDQGEYTAAVKLRRAFPLSIEVPKT